MMRHSFPAGQAARIETLSGDIQTVFGDDNHLNITHQSLQRSELGINSDG